MILSCPTPFGRCERDTKIKHIAISIKNEKGQALDLSKNKSCCIYKMNLRLLLIVCGTFMFTQSQTTQNSNEQAIYKIKELAAVYAILFNSFDYREASSDFLRIDENQAEINEFALILDNIFNELENNPIIINLSRFERYDLFIEEFNKLQRSKNVEAKPIPFKVLRYHLRRFFTSLTSNTHSDFCREWNIFSETSNEQINQAIEQITSTDNIRRMELW